MIGARLGGRDLNGKGVEIVSVFLVRRVGQERIDGVGRIHSKLCELAASITFGKHHNVEPVRDWPTGQNGLH